MSPVFWLYASVGWLAMGFGFWTLIERKIELVSFGAWFVGGLVIHDFILAPVVWFSALAMSGLMPGKVWRRVRVPFAMSAVVVLFAIPFIAGFGRRPANPTVLPNNYAVGTALTVGIIWIFAVGAWALSRMRRPVAGSRD